MARQLTHDVAGGSFWGTQPPKTSFSQCLLLNAESRQQPVPTSGVVGCLVALTVDVGR